MMLMFRATHRALMAAKDAELAVAAHEIARLHGAMETERARHDALVSQFAARAMELSQPKPPPTLPPKRERTAIDTAIDLKAGNDRALRGYLGQWAQRELRAGKSTDDVANAILTGEPSSDEEGIL